MNGPKACVGCSWNGRGGQSPFYTMTVLFSEVSMLSLTRIIKQGPDMYCFTTAIAKQVPNITLSTHCSHLYTNQTCWSMCKFVNCSDICRFEAYTFYISGRVKCSEKKSMWWKGCKESLIIFPSHILDLGVNMANFFVQSFQSNNVFCSLLQLLAEPNKAVKGFVSKYSLIIVGLNQWGRELAVLAIKLSSQFWSQFPGTSTSLQSSQPCFVQ